MNGSLAPSAWRRLLLAYVGVIYLTLPLLPVAVRWIRSTFGTRPITLFAPALFAVLAVFFLLATLRRGSVEALLHLLTLALASALVLVCKRQNPVEQVHLVEYGLVGFMSYRASGRRPGTRVDPAFLLWTAFALAAGIADELVQGILPNRVCDPTDMVANAVSVVIGMDAAASRLPPGSEGGIAPLP